MQKWQEFEESATQFLNGYFSEFTFQNKGSSDSAAPDIEVYTKDGEFVSNIEAKYSPSQAGQIVVLTKDGHFEFSNRSKNPKVPATDKLIAYLNHNYALYSDVAQSSLPIEMEDKTLFAFIIEQYRLKGNHWIIASSKSSALKKEDLTLITLDKISQYFEVSASLRRKKSGTSSLSKSMRESAALEVIKDIFDNFEIKIEGKRTFFYGDIGTHSQELPQNLYLSPKGENIYEIKKRSTTNNTNIMFSLKLKETHEFQAKEFLDFLRSKVS